MSSFRRIAAYALGAAILAASGAAQAQQPRTLRIAMTASDVPTTTGMPNNGFEGMRFLGYPSFEALTLWDLSAPVCARASRNPGNRTPPTRRSGASACAAA